MVRTLRVLLLLSIAASLAACDPAPPSDGRGQGGPQPAAQAGSAPPMEQGPAPAQVVETFGERLDMVSILAPAEEVEKAMRDSWGALVDPPLLERWIAAPADSPGRATSSPRPDRIEVEETQRLAEDRALVRGVLVESTSAGDSARRPVRIELERSHGRWMITSFVPEAPPEGEENHAHDAARVVAEYYAALDDEDYRRAWSLWGPSGAPGQTFEQFAAGYASTESVRAETGAPSRVEAAAGSRYVEVPVTISARQKDGSVRRFSGTYTVRRSVVDGASEAQRRWHLDRANLRAETGP